MLLDLYANEVDGTLICISSACIASGVPTSTALGWIRKLEVSGLIIRQQDDSDGRRTFLRITERAAAAVELWINSTFLH